MWPLESEFGKEHVEYEDLEEGDLLIGSVNSRALSPDIVYKVNTLTIPSGNHFIISEFCRTTSATPIYNSQNYYILKSRVGENATRILRIQDVNLKRLFKSFAFARTFDPSQLKKLLIELDI